MRGGLSHNQIKAWTRAAFCCAALVLLLLVLGGLSGVQDRSFSTPEPVPTPTPRETVGVAAVFGTTDDPFCAAFLSDLEALCEAGGWRLIQYDCVGRANIQQGQVEDFLKNETADVAILYAVGEQEELEARAKALYKRCPVVTVGQGVRHVAKRYVAAHVGAEEDGQIKALCGYFQESRPKVKEVLVLLDLPDEERKARDQAFEDGNVAVLDENYTWGDKIYAERYLETGLELFPEADAIVCASRNGTQGALNSLRQKDLRSTVKIAALDYDQSMAEDLALGDLDAAAVLSPKEMAEGVADLLPKVLKKEKIEEKPLTYHVLTPENMDKLDLGYEP